MCIFFSDLFCFSYKYIPRFFSHFFLELSLNRQDKTPDLFWMSSVLEFQDLSSSNKIISCFTITTANLEVSFQWEVPEQSRTNVDPCGLHKNLSSDHEYSNDVSCLLPIVQFGQKYSLLHRDKCNSKT